MGAKGKDNSTNRRKFLRLGTTALGGVGIGAMVSGIPQASAQGILPDQAYDYLIFNEGGLTKARKDDGTIEFQDSDAQQVIQNAINSGNEIMIKGGTYLLSSSLLIQKSNFSMRMNRNTILKATNPATNVISVSDNGAYSKIEIDGGEIDGANNPGSGIYVGRTASYITINGIFIHNCGENGIYFNKAYRSLISNCHIHNNTGDGILLQHGANDNKLFANELTINKKSGIEIHTASFTNVSTNVVYWNKINGIYLHSGSIENMLIGNVIEYNLSDGISLASANDNMVQSNILAGESYDNPGTFSEIHLLDSGRNIFMGNRIRCLNLAKHGILEQGTSSNNQYVGNIVDESVDEPIFPIPP